MPAPDDPIVVALPSALTAADVVKRYGRDVLALDGVSLAVPTGSITALVGPNGAGKSTLIKAWVGFERPSSGHVISHGHDPFRERAAALAAVAYVPQSPALYRDLTVDDHLDLARTLRHDFDRATARDRLDRLGIRPAARASQLSGGQAAQVGLALALGTRAPVLLLDEPLASLDPLARREFLHVLVEAVRTDGRTALLSSHVITDVEQACDRLLVLGDGRLLLDSSLRDAIDSHGIAEGAGAVETLAVSTFPGPDGLPVTLVKGRSSGPGVRPATLEEVVLGYLATARQRAREEAA